MLSACAAKFARAICDPFSLEARGACIPTFPAAPSQKVTLFSRFTLGVGTQGLGFIYITPTLAADQFTAFYTTPTFTGSTLGALSATNTTVSGVAGLNWAGCPYNSANLTSTIGDSEEGVGGRLVAVGIRIQYIGTTLNESGLYTAYAHPTHLNVNYFNGSPMTVGSLGSLSNAITRPVTREPLELTMFPVDASELAYANQSLGATPSNASDCCYPWSPNGIWNNAYTYSNNGVLMGAPIAMICIQQPVGSTGNFYVEMVGHVEYTGELCNGVSTRTESDPVAVDHIVCAAQQTQIRENAGKSLGAAFMDGLRDITRSTKQFAFDLSESAAYGYARGATAQTQAMIKY